MIPKTLLDKGTEGDKIVSFDLSDDLRSVTITERCDEWYRVNLNKNEFGAFISELEMLHARMKA